MHTVELLDEAMEVARTLGYEIRQDWLGGDGGGHCLVRGRKWLLIDLAQSCEDQLAEVAMTLTGEPLLSDAVISQPLASYLNVRRAA